MPPKKHNNIYIIGENHNMSARTVVLISKILTSASADAKVAIVSELGMCNAYRGVDHRIAACDEEPVCMNTINSLISLIAALCGYNIRENKEWFHNTYPNLLQLGWVPKVGDVTKEQDRKAVIDTLIAHTMTILKECSPPSLYRIYRDMLNQSLPHCNDVNKAINISNDLRDRWLAQKAIENSKNYDIVIIIAGYAHLQRLFHLLGPLSEGHVWS